MARSSQPKSGASRVRFIMLEADIQDGDLAQITQAIQNALRPAAPPVTRLIQATPLANGDAADLAVDDYVEEFPADEDVRVERPARNRKSRVARTPTVLDDIDVDSSPGLKEFIAQFDLKSGVDKYLVIALWFRDARGVQTITVDHIYTCFRLLGWSTASADFSKTLRNLRDEQSLRGGARDGYCLTLTGAGKIEEKKRP